MTVTKTIKISCALDRKCNGFDFWKAMIHFERMGSEKSYFTIFCSTWSAYCSYSFLLSLVIFANGWLRSTRVKHRTLSAAVSRLTPLSTPSAPRSYWIRTVKSEKVAQKSKSRKVAVNNVANTYSLHNNFTEEFFQGAVASWGQWGRATPRSYNRINCRSF